MFLQMDNHRLNRTPYREIAMTQKRSGLSRPARFAVALAVATVLASCSDSAQGDREQIVEEWRSTVDASMAHYPQANEAQREVLERSLASGEVTFQDYKERMLAYVTCLEGSIEGQVEVSEAYEQLGLPIIEVGIVMPEGEEVSQQDDAVRESCYQAEVSLVSDLYTSQPAATEAYNALAQEYRSALLECLDSAGITVDKDAPISEILAADAETSAAAGDGPRNPCAISTGFIGAQTSTR